MAGNRTIEYTIGFKPDPQGINQVKQSFQQITSQVEKMRLNDYMKLNPNIDSTKINSELQKTKNSMRGLNEAFNSSFNKDLGTVNVAKFNNELKKSNVDLKAVFNVMTKMGQQGTFRQLASQVLNTNLKLKETNSLTQKFSQTLANTIKWKVSSSVLDSFTGAIQGAYGYVKALDSSLNDIRIVTGASADEMERFAEKANEAARGLATSTNQYVKANLIYRQQGLGEEESMARAETTIKAANVTGLSTSETSELLTAVWNGYRIGAEQTESSVDKLAAVAANSASNLAELSTAMSKVASSASTMGVDMDQLNATIATIISVTRQAPESVGTALKTIYARLGDLMVDGEDESGVKLGTVSSTMEELGIKILDEQGNMREMGTVIEETAEKWQSWTQAQKEAAAVAMAGKRQYNNLIALFENWDMYTNALDKSRNSLGTLQEQQDVYLDSTKAHLQKLSTAVEGIQQDLLSPKVMNSVIDGFTSVVTTIQKVVDSLGGAKTVFTLLAAVVVKALSGPIAQGFSTMIINMQNARSNAQQLRAEYELLQKFGQADPAVLGKMTSRRQQLIDMNRGQINPATFNREKELESNWLAANQKVEDRQKRTQEAKQYYDSIAKEGQKLDQLGSLDEKGNVVIGEGNVFKEGGATGEANALQSRVDKINDILKSNKENLKTSKELQKAEMDVLETEEKQKTILRENKDLEKQIEKTKEAQKSAADKLQMAEEAVAKAKKASKEADETALTAMDNMNKKAAEQKKLQAQRKQLIEQQSKQQNKTTTLSADELSTLSIIDEQKARLENPNLEENDRAEIEAYIKELESSIPSLQEEQASVDEEELKKQIQSLDEQIAALEEDIAKDKQKADDAIKEGESAEQQEKEALTDQKEAEEAKKLADQNAKAIEEEAEALEKQNNALDATKKHFNEVKEKSKGVTDAMMKQAEEVLGDSDAFKELQEQYDALNNVEEGDGIEGYTADLEEFKKAFKEAMESARQEAQDANEALREEIDGTADAEKQESEALAEELETSFSEESIKGFGDNLGQLAGQTLQVYTGFLAISNLGTTWADDSISGVEKVTQSISVLLMMLPMMMSGASGAVKAIKGMGAALNGVRASLAGATLATEGMTAAERMANAEKIKSISLWKALKKAVVENPVGAIITGIVVALSAVAAILNMVKKNREEEIQALENEANKQNELTQEIQTQKDAVDNLASSYENLAQAYKEGDSPLEKLRVQTAELLKNIGRTDLAIQALSGSYEDLTNLIKTAQVEQNNALIEQLENSVDANKEVIDEKSKDSLKDLEKLAGKNEEIKTLKREAIIEEIAGAAGAVGGLAMTTGGVLSSNPFLAAAGIVTLTGSGTAGLTGQSNDKEAEEKIKELEQTNQAFVEEMKNQAYIDDYEGMIRKASQIGGDLGEQAKKFLQENKEYISQLKEQKDQIRDLNLENIGLENINSEDITNLQEYQKARKKLISLSESQFTDTLDASAKEQAKLWASSYLVGLEEGFFDYERISAISDKISETMGISVEVASQKVESLTVSEQEFLNSHLGLFEANAHELEKQLTALLKEEGASEEIIESFLGGLSPEQIAQLATKDEAEIKRFFNNLTVYRERSKLESGGDFNLFELSNSDKDEKAIDEIAEKTKKWLKDTSNDADNYLDAFLHKYDEAIEFQEKRRVGGLIMSTLTDESNKDKLSSESIESLYEDVGFSETFSISQSDFKNLSLASQKAALIDYYTTEATYSKETSEQIQKDLNEQIAKLEERDAARAKWGETMTHAGENLADYLGKDADALQALFEKVGKEGVEQLSDAEKKLFNDILKKEHLFKDKDAAIEYMKNVAEGVEVYSTYTDNLTALQDALVDVEEHTFDTAKVQELINQELDSTNKSIDSIQSAYKTLTSAVEEYNENGYISMDTLQAILDMDDQYLSALEFQDGTLKINQESIKAITKARLQDAKVIAVQTAMNELAALAEQQEAGKVDEVTAALQNNIYISEQYGATLEGLNQALAEGAAAFDVYYAAMTRNAGIEEGTVFEQRANEIGQALKDRLMLISSLENASDFAGVMGVSSSSSNKADEADFIDLLEDEKDVYHDINVELEKMSKRLDRLKVQQDKVFGAELIKNLDEQSRLLQKQAQAEEIKLRVAKEQAALQKQTLVDYGASFYEDGQISNYEALYDSRLNAINALINEYNAMSKDEQEANKEIVDQAKEDFDKLKKAIEDYEETINSTIPDVEDSIRDALNENIEINIQKFNMEVELRLNLNEAERNWNEFLQRAVEKSATQLSNIVTLRRQLNTYYKEDNNGDIQAFTKQVEKTMAEIEDIQSKGFSDFYGDNLTQALEDLKTYNEQLMSSLISIEDLLDQAKETYFAMIDEASEAFNEQAQTYQTISNLYEHDKSIVAMIYGEDAYEAMEKLYRKQAENNIQNLDFLRQQADFYRTGLDTAMAGGDEEEIKKWKEKWTDAIEELNSAVESAAQNIVNQYGNAINKIFDDIANKLTDNQGLEYAQQIWELQKKVDSSRLDTVNKTYALTSLERKINKAISDTDSISAQQKLNKLREEEVDTLREKEKVTQYDVDRANKLYDITLKQIALEDAQKNKSTMKLRRDSQGNYSYVYTADDDDIADKQQALADAYNDLYNFDKNAYKQNLDDAQALYKEWADAMTAIANDKSLTDEEREQRMAEITMYYSDLINERVASNLEIRENLTQSANDSMQMSTEGFANYVKDVVIDGTLVPGWNSGIQSMIDKIAGEGGFGPVSNEVIHQIMETWNEYQANMDAVQAASNQDFASMKEGIDATSEATKALLQNNNNLIESYSKEVEAVRKVFNEIKGLVTAYASAASAATKAATAAHSMWASFNQDAANAAANVQAVKAQYEELAKAAAEPITITTVHEDVGGSGSAQESAPDNTMHSYHLEWIDTHNRPRKSYNVEGTYAKGTFSSMLSNWNSQGAFSDMNLTNGMFIVSDSGETKALQVTRTNNDTPASIFENMKKQLDALDFSFDTGGYTGAWGSSGKAAILHEKEIVLNKDDTSNFLKAIDITRSIANIVSAINGNVSNGLSNAFGAITSSLVNAYNGNTNSEQNITINASFPNATNRNEIVSAFNELQNLASQRAFNTIR